MKINIRPYTPADKPACMACFESNVPKWFTVEEIAEYSNFLDNYGANKMLKPNGISTRFYVLELNGEIIGAGGFGDRFDTLTITLAWGHIHKDYHKKGFGKKLLEFRLNTIKALHPGHSVYIDTTQHSVGFYEKYGFKTTLITKDFYAQGMDRYDLELRIS